MNFNPKYPHLFAPMKVGNVVLKNRMLASPSRPHFIQGPEAYPSENMITHYQNKARNGAAVVTCNVLNPMPGTGGKIRSFDYKDEACQNYISHMCEAIHFYESKASVFLWPFWPEGRDVSDGIHGEGPHGAPPGKAMTEKQIRDMIEDYADQAARLQELGFDMCYLHAAYRGMLIARFLSPLSNTRADDWGGSFENRIRFPLCVCDRIKEKCGSNFLIEMSISGDDGVPGGVTIDDTIAFIKRGVGHFDLAQLRSGSIDPNHPTGYTKAHVPFLYMAETVKKADTGMPIETIGGVFYPQDAEDIIASGKADFVAMARAWVSNPEYGKLCYEGRGDDIRPCIRCNKCHRSSPKSIWVSVCSVNPTWGLEHKLDKLVTPVERKKRVAVVGGGPAGMQAALTLADRGHQVTLYEKSGALGGQLIAAGLPSFKWPLRDFCGYLIRQVGKKNIDVRLNTNATAKLLARENYDDVVVAIGSDPVRPRISGIDGRHVFFAADAILNEDKLGKNVVIVGGGDIGCETGLYLAEKGHRVQVVEMTGDLAPESQRVHYYTMFMDYVQRTPGFSFTLNATCTEIRPDGISFLDAEEVKHNLKADSVVVSVGTRAKSDEAVAMYNPGERCFLAGDCFEAATVQKAIRSGWAAAVQI